jgi:hypothetical protein
LVVVGVYPRRGGAELAIEVDRAEVRSTAARWRGEVARRGWGCSPPR